MSLEELHRVALLDLTLADLARVEKMVGVRSSSWGSDAVVSDAELLGAILAVGNGLELAQVVDVPMRRLQELVDMEGAGSHPTPASTTSTPT